VSAPRSGSRRRSSAAGAWARASTSSASRGWETFEHEADVGLVLRAPTGPALFEVAGDAFFSLVCEPDTVRAETSYALSGDAGDVGSLLVDWLNDLVWVVQGLGALCSRFELESWTESSYYATALGEPIGFVRRTVQDGAVFEAVGLDSARTCAVVDARGELRLVAGEKRAAEPHGRPVAAARFSTSVSRAAAAALVACARPRDDQAA
jgi:SHS2 domain-containing protein